MPTRGYSIERAQFSQTVTILGARVKEVKEKFVYIKQQQQQDCASMMLGQAQPLSGHEITASSLATQYVINISCANAHLSSNLPFPLFLPLLFQRHDSQRLHSISIYQFNNGKDVERREAAADCLVPDHWPDGGCLFLSPKQCKQVDGAWCRSTDNRLYGSAR